VHVCVCVCTRYMVCCMCASMCVCACVCVCTWYVVCCMCVWVCVWCVYECGVYMCVHLSVSMGGWKGSMSEKGTG